MLDATRGERWTHKFQPWPCRSPQLSLWYYFTEPPRGVPTSWKATAGTLRSRSIGKTFSLRWPFTRLASEACLCCVAAVAKDSRVSQTSSIPGYFQRISFSFKNTRHAAEKCLCYLYTGGGNGGKRHKSSLQRGNIASLWCLMICRSVVRHTGQRCRRSGSQKKSSSQEIPPQKKIWFRTTAEIFMALPPEGKTVVLTLWWKSRSPITSPITVLLHVCVLCAILLCVVATKQILGSVFHVLEPAPLLGHCVLAVCSLFVKSVLSPAKQKWNYFLQLFWSLKVVFLMCTWTIRCPTTTSKGEKVQG